MAPNDTLDWKAKKQTQPTSVTNASTLFSSTASKSHPFEATKINQELATAVDKVTGACKQSFALCDRLPKSPIFKTADGEVTVKDGVLGAIGEEAAKLLKLDQAAPELTSSPGLGMSGQSMGIEPE